MGGGMVRAPWEQLTRAVSPAVPIHPIGADPGSARRLRRRTHRDDHAFGLVDLSDRAPSGISAARTAIDILGTGQTPSRIWIAHCHEACHCHAPDAAAP